MSARGIIGGLAGMAASAAKHPLSTTEQALVAAKQMATTGTIVADKLIKKGMGKSTSGTKSDLASPAQHSPAPVRQATASATTATAQTVEKAAAKVERAAEKVADKADKVESRAAATTETTTAAPKPKKPAAAKPKAPASGAATPKPSAPKPAAKKPAAKKPAAKKAPAKQAKKDEPNVVLAVDFPAPPEEPPVDVVGEALAKEAEQERQGGPTGSVLPPVRDKDEAGVDPATLKAVRAEAEMMTKAASPRKS